MKRITYGLLVALFLATISGCATTGESRFYTLDATAKAVDVQPLGYSVLVGPVSVPDVVDRPQIVVQVAPNRVELDDFNRWAGSLDEAITGVLVKDLTVLLGTSDIVAAPLANFNPAFRVTINVQRFESVAGKKVVDDAVWTVTSAASGNTTSGHSVASEAVHDMSFDALAAAHSRALAHVSADIAAAIRATAAVDSTRTQ